MGKSAEQQYVAVSPNNTELIEGWYQDAKGSNFQLIKIKKPLPVDGYREALEKILAIQEDDENLQMNRTEMLIKINAIIYRALRPNQ